MSAVTYELHIRDEDSPDDGTLVMRVPGRLTEWPYLARLRNRAEHDDYKLEGEPGADPFSQAQAYGRWLSGQLAETLDLHDDQGRYIVTLCGGTPYWHPRGERMHQIGSAGFCWDCLRGEYTEDGEPLGLIRHPITPGEVQAGAPGYECFVCSARLGEEHADIPHVVIWGEESHPRCRACGLGYQTATPEGIGYMEHDPACPRLHGEYLHLPARLVREGDVYYGPDGRLSDDDWDLVTGVALLAPWLTRITLKNGRQVDLPGEQDVGIERTPSNEEKVPQR